MIDSLLGQLREAGYSWAAGGKKRLREGFSNSRGSNERVGASFGEETARDTTWQGWTNAASQKRNSSMKKERGKRRRHKRGWATSDTSLEQNKCYLRIGGKQQEILMNNMAPSVNGASETIDIERVSGREKEKKRLFRLWAKKDGPPLRFQNTTPWGRGATR